MAFNILVELPETKVDWQYLNKGVDDYKEIIDIFPIPSNKVCKKNYIGVSISRPVNEEKKEAVLKVIDYFVSLNYKVVELYSHKVFTLENIKTLVDSFF